MLSFNVGAYNNWERLKCVTWKINVTDLLLKVEKKETKKEYTVSVRDFFRTCLLLCVCLCVKEGVYHVRNWDLYNHITNDLWEYMKY